MSIAKYLGLSVTTIVSVFFGVRAHADVVPLGGQFQVNTTPGIQSIRELSLPTVGAGPDGQFAIIWQHNPGYTHTSRGQRFGPSGAFVDPEFVVASAPLESDFFARGEALAYWPSGSSVIVIGSGLPPYPSPPWGDSGILAQRYDATGALDGLLIPVSETTGVGNYNADVCILPNGNFVVAWNDWGNTDDPIMRHAKARVFSPSGVPITSEFLAAEPSIPEDPRNDLADLACAADGRFMVAYFDGGTTEADPIVARFFESDGTPAGAAIVLGINQYPYDVVVTGTGHIAAGWTEIVPGTDPTVYVPKLGIFDSSTGAAIGPPVDVSLSATNPANTVATTRVHLEATDDGEILALWLEKIEPSTVSSAGFGQSRRLYARRFSAEGVPVGLQFTVNEDPLMVAPSLENADIAGLPHDRAVATWHDVRDSVDPLAYNVFARRMRWRPAVAPAAFLNIRVKISGGAPPFERLEAFSLRDAQYSEASKVIKPAFLATPVTPGMEGILDPQTHLIGYKIAKAKGAGKTQKTTGAAIEDVVAQQTIDLGTAKYVFVPANVDAVDDATPPDPSAHALDYYRCFAAKTTKGTPKLPKGTQLTLLNAQQTSRTYELKKLSTLCYATSALSAGVKNPSARLACYKAKLAKGQPQFEKQEGLYVADAVGTPTQFDLFGEKEVCVFAPERKVDFDASEVEGKAQLQVQFTNLSSPRFDTFEWDFGDNSPPSNEKNPFHAFNNSGAYVVTLTASEQGNNAEIEKKIGYIQVY